MSSSKRNQPYQGLTTLKTLIVGLSMLIVGVLLLVLVAWEFDFWRKASWLRAVIEDLGSLLLVSVALGAIWELIGKRSFAREVLEAAGTSVDISSAGLRSIGTSWPDDADWARLFNGVRELDIFVAYARAWRSLHLQRLQEVARRKGARIRVFLPDPTDTLTTSVLAERFGVTPAKLIERITETKSDFEDLRVKGGATIEVYYWAGDRVFSLYRFDHTAVITLYKHRKAKVPDVPTIVCESGALFDFATKEMSDVHSRSRPA
ncbi:hypothetical protein [Nonomuraea sp. NPDC050202]|jgi:hypothetical protein|uniref:hypothetical protein n=1 Tax=Nonomuraea sp. NPDC050202 TaxID=3155035 RepID=UPI0033CC9DDE